MRVELGPSAMILDSGVERMWSISSRNGVQVRGNAETQGVLNHNFVVSFAGQEVARLWTRLKSRR